MNIIKFENQHIPQVVEIHQLELEVGLMNHIYWNGAFDYLKYEKFIEDEEYIKQKG